MLPVSPAPTPAITRRTNSRTVTARPRPLALPRAARVAHGAVPDARGSMAAWREHVEASRAHVEAAPDLGTRGARSPETLRWVLAKVGQEYARHNGHADLLRQVLDGAAGE